MPKTTEGIAKANTKNCWGTGEANVFLASASAILLTAFELKFECWLLNSVYFSYSQKPIQVFSKSYYQTINTFQSSYIPLVIFSRSYYPTINIFHTTYKPLPLNKTIKTFSGFISNNINNFRELLPNNTDFFRIYVKQPSCKN